jgi:hypothetical protein
VADADATGGRLVAEMFGELRDAADFFAYMQAIAQ